jgi:hypothetical protein
MKKKIATMVALVLVLVLVFAVPVQARGLDLPSFDFASTVSFGLDVDYTLPDEILALAEQFHSEFFDMSFSVPKFTVSESGTFYSDGFAVSIFRELEMDFAQFLTMLPAEEIAPMLAMLNLNLSEPIRTWVEMDFNDLSQPIFKIIVEMPSFVRLPLMFVNAEMSRQFWVLDLSAEIAELIEELEVEFRQLTEEQLAQTMAYLEELLDELLVFLDEYRDIIEEEINAAWEFIQEAVDIRTLIFGFDELANGYSAYFSFAATVSVEGVVADIEFDFYGEVTNIGTAQRVALPELTETNSLNVMELLADFV